MDPSYLLMSVLTSTLFGQGEKNWYHISLFFIISFCVTHYKRIYEKIRNLWKHSTTDVHIYSENDNGTRNIVYSAIIWYISNKLKNDAVYEQSSVNTDFSRFYSDEKSPYKKFPVYDILYSNEITYDELTYSFDYEKVNKEKIVYTKYCVIIKGKNIDQIKLKIDTITQNYKNHLQKQENKKIITNGFLIYTMNKEISYGRNQNTWESKHVTLNKTFDNLFIPDQNKTNIKNSVQKLLHDDNYYNIYAIPRKLTILLHGEPGCGKTSLYLTLANQYKMPIYIVKNKETLEANVKDIPEKSIIVFEEIDTLGIKNREHIKDDEKDKKDDSKECLRIILELLDGNYTLPEKSIVIMTTNYLHRLDPAVYRKGRVDYLIELEKPNREIIKNIFEYYYNDTQITDDDLKKLDGILPTCEYTNSILLNIDNQQEAINNLLKLI